MYTVQYAEEWGIGESVNGLGRRPRIKGWYVINPYGRRVRAFTGADAETKAREWAAFCTENFS